MARPIPQPTAPRVTRLSLAHTDEVWAALLQFHANACPEIALVDLVREAVAAYLGDPNDAARIEIRRSAFRFAARRARQVLSQAIAVAKDVYDSTPIPVPDTSDDPRA